jgi:hypothetical protein
MEMYQKVSLIIAFSAVGIVVIYLYYKSIRDYYRMQRRDKAAEEIYKSHLASATPGYAYCRNVQTIGVSRFGDALIKVRVELDVYTGGLQHYIAVVPWSINWMHLGKLTADLEIAVRVDIGDKTLVYPAVHWLKFDITEEVGLFKDLDKQA